MTALVQARELVKHYGDFRALDGLSFQLDKGSVTGLLGPNGAGKTTLMKCLLGFLPIRSGTCEVLGRSLSDAPLEVRRLVGFMPEHEARFPGLTGLESVVYSGRLSGMPKEAAFSRAYEVLDYLGMDEVRHRDVAGYSVGQKQKIKLGQALVHGPRLCFLDEPLSGLDPRSRDEMMDLLTGIAASGVSMILSSHVLKDIETICSDVLVLDRGRLLYQGAMAELRNQGVGRYRLLVRGDADPLVARLQQDGATVQRQAGGLEVDLPQDRDAALIWAAARDTKTPVRALSPAADSLEQAFLRLLGRGD